MRAPLGHKYILYNDTDPVGLLDSQSWQTMAGQSTPLTDKEKEKGGGVHRVV